MKTNYVGTLAVLACMSSGLAQNGTGKISGIVIGSDGKLLTAVITVSGVGTGGSGVGVRAQSAVDGSFTLAGLTAGSYQLCAMVSDGAYLDPCDWSSPGFPLQLTNGQVVTGRRVIMEKASTLHVRINDLAGVLDTGPQGGKDSPHVLVGIFTNRHLFVALSVANKDKGGKDLEGAIPFDRSVPLHLVGRNVQLTDGAGLAVDLTGATVSVKQASGAPALRLTYNAAAKTP
jgi:hypothetical protein